MNSDRHDAVASWFLGPPREKFGYLERLFSNTQLRSLLVVYFGYRYIAVTADMSTRTGRRLLNQHC